MSSILKTFFIKRFPAIYFIHSAYRNHSHCKAAYSGIQMQFASTIYPSGEITILTGPFSGLKYFNKTIWGPITPKWIGSYEEELHTVIYGVISNKYPSIIDVGAAEGYYAVGLASRCHSSQVTSFDIDPFARRRQKQLADLNNVSNLTIKKYCSHETLTKMLTKSSLLICDIEGSEYELLDLDCVPELACADILVEVHSFGNIPGDVVRDHLFQMFSLTHQLTFIPVAGRDPGAYLSLEPILMNMDSETLSKALFERGTGSIGWLWMQSNNGLALRPHVSQL